MNNFLRLGLRVATTAACVQGCAGSSESKDVDEGDLRSQVSVTCKIFAKLGSEDSIPTKAELLAQATAGGSEDTLSISIPFKSSDGLARLMSVKVRRINLEPQAAFGSLLTQVGVDYAFNNPFELGSIFARNDRTGQFSVSGKRFVFEGETNALDAVRVWRGKTNFNTFNPYLLIKMTPQSPRERLTAPDGRTTDYLVLSCANETK
jgi:hypothetical protein